MLVCLFDQSPRTHTSVCFHFLEMPPRTRSGQIPMRRALHSADPKQSPPSPKRTVPRNSSRKRKRVRFAAGTKTTSTRRVSRVKRSAPSPDVEPEHDFDDTGSAMYLRWKTLHELATMQDTVRDLSVALRSLDKARTQCEEPDGLFYDFSEALSPTDWHNITSKPLPRLPSTRMAYNAVVTTAFYNAKWRNKLFI